MKKSLVALLAVVFVIGACSSTTEPAAPSPAGTSGREQPTQIAATATREPALPRPTAPGRVKLGDLLFFASHLDFESDSVEDSWSEIYTASADGKGLSCLTCDLEEMTVIAPGSLADLSPDSSMVTFSMLTAIEDNYAPMVYVFEIETRKLRQVTYGNSLRWSPDGKYIALVGILLTDLEGNIECISCEFEDQPGYYLDSPTTLSWSPKGRWFAFKASSSDGEQIFKITDDGKNWLPLTENPGFTAFRNPAWSPDGKYIAYDVTAGPIENISMETWVMGQDGTNHRCLTCDIEPLSPEEIPYSTNLGWSPKGELLVGTIYSFNPYQDGTYRILELGANASKLELSIASLGGGLQTLVRLDVDRPSQERFEAFLLVLGTSPSWSSDGEKIAFVHGVGGSNEIFVMDSDGSNLRQITDTPDQDEHSPSWLR